MVATEKPSITEWNGFIVPVIHEHRVYHIGTLNINDRGRQGDSLEGNCLSISKVPVSWRKIAKLGGFPLKELSNDGVLFFDMHAAHKDECLRESIKQWGISEGLIEEKELWQAWTQDDEDDEWRYMLLASEDDAFVEVGYEYDDPSEVPGPDDQPGIRSVVVMVGTEYLTTKVMHKTLHDCDAMDYLLIHWAQVLFPEIDGVYWTDYHDPERLSAPRGGIFPDRLSRLSVVNIDWGMVNEDIDDELYNGMH